MERDKSFYCIFVMFLFVTCYTTCYLLSNRIIEFGGLIATASAVIYPLTYFISVLFYEKYGKNKVFELINLTIISLIFTGLIIGLASTFGVYNGPDGLENIFKVDFRILFASIVSFMVGQYINIRLYAFLGHKKGLDFLIAGVIAITIDSFLFIGLSYLGVSPISEVVTLATGQYVLSVIVILVYALCFNSIMPALLLSKKKEQKEAESKSKKKTTTTKKKTITNKKA